MLFSQLDRSTLRPTAYVAATIAVLFFGSLLLNSIIPVSAVGPGGPGPGGPDSGGPQPTQGPGGPGPGPVTTPLPPGSTLTLGPLRIPLQNGWVPQDVPDSGIIVRLVKGSVAVDVLGATLQGQAGPGDVYSAYITDLQNASPGMTATQPSSIQVGNGVPAVRGEYTGIFGQNQIEGEVTAFVAGNQGWLFDIWGSAGTLGPLRSEAQQMVNNIQVQ